MPGVCKELVQLYKVVQLFKAMLYNFQTQFKMKLIGVMLKFYDIHMKLTRFLLGSMQLKSD